MSKCHFCRGELKKARVDIARYWGKELIALYDVPALVCIQCGERFFEAKVSKKIDKKIKDVLYKRSVPQTINVPVAQF